VRVDEQRRHKREGWERRRRLADRRSARSDEALAALRHRAEEALATEGMERTRLGYDVLVRIKVEELLERDDLSEPLRDDRPAPDGVVAAAGAS
jgi:hypothetical protein